MYKSASSIGFQEGLDKIKEMVIAATVAREEAEKVSLPFTDRQTSALGDGTLPVYCLYIDRFEALNKHLPFHPL